jgi:hypothetical protein
MKMANLSEISPKRKSAQNMIDYLNFYEKRYLDLR